MDAPAAERDGGAADPSAWAAEFRVSMREVEDAAREWGVRPHAPEGRFISALMTAMRLLGDVSRTGQAGVQETLREARLASQADLEVVRALNKTAQTTVHQAHTALISLELERENLIRRMLNEVMPSAIDRLRAAIVIREQRWNRDVARRRMALSGAVALVVFLSGYEVRAWSDGPWMDAFDRCVVHPRLVDGHGWCDVTDLMDPPSAGSAGR